MSDITLSSLIYNLSFDHLATLKAIAECGSFKGAAEKLLMTQPAVSQRVKHMEAVVGTPLFDRQPGTSATLTPFGERMLALANQVLDDLKHFQQELSRVATPTAGDVVKVAAGPSYIKYRLLTVVQSFGRDHPEVEVRLRHSPLLDHVLHTVLEHDADIGIYPANPPQRKVQKFPLAQDEIVLVARPDFLAVRVAENLMADALSDAPLALPSYSANSRQLLEAWATQYDVTLRVAIEADNLDTLKQAALQGMAVACVPRFTVERELADGLLSIVIAPGLPLKRYVWIIIDGHTMPSASTRFFVDYLTQYTAEHYGAVATD